MYLSVLTKPLLFFVLLTLLPWQLNARDDSNPVITIIIDDIGYRLREDLRAIGLPGQVAYAIMPHSPHAEKMSNLANELGKEVLLHMPMQATEEEKNRFLGPGALTLQMTHSEFIQALDLSLRSVPHARGLNNHMGSLLTRHPGHMSWLMQSLKSRNIFYVDSVTSNQSVAGNVAREIELPHLKRDVFLDNVQTHSNIERQFRKLVALAKRRGTALGIGHPHPETMAVLSRNLLLLEEFGVRLVSPSQMLDRNRANTALRKVSLRNP